MSGTPNSGSVKSDRTFCKDNPNFTSIIELQGNFYTWAIFHNVPWRAGLVSLEWGQNVFSPWVDPWYSTLSPPAANQMPAPAECPQELVDLKTCQTHIPQGKAPNLIVLVHGAQTTPADLRVINELADQVVGETLWSGNQNQTSLEWEIVVWDWTMDYTTNPPTPMTPNTGILNSFEDVRTAYENSIKKAPVLATAITNGEKMAGHRYKYVHLVGHSAGANLIDSAAKELVINYQKEIPNANERPFVHLTFLDAFTWTDSDKNNFGLLPHYPKHYSEQYVDRNPNLVANPIGPWSDTILASAFNFDISDWQPISRTDPDEKEKFGHQWPRYWYEKSAISHWYEQTGFKYGYHLSFEGSGKGFDETVNELANYTPGGCIKLNTIRETANCSK